MTLTLEAALSRIIEADLPGFIDCRIDSVHSRGNLGDTPLHIAAFWGDTEMVCAFLDAGADIDSKGEDDHTPLHYAIEAEKAEAARLLISRGANPRIKDWLGYDAIAACAESSNEAIKALLHET